MILGLDPGEKRVGVAVADLETRFARPLEVIDASAVDLLARIRELVEERDVEKIVVGRPVGLSGEEGAAIEAQRKFVARLKNAVDVEVAEFDERLTTVVAERGLRAAGLDARGRKGLRDAVAAQVMLQDYLDRSR